jgi:HK97 gp10 family phage protein
MAGDVAVQVNGLDDLKRKLEQIPKALRRSVLRNALAAGAREVRDTAKRAAPVLNLGTSLQAPYRKPGTVRDAIRVRTSKADRKAGNVGVFVNVRPLPGNKFKRDTRQTFFRGKVKTWRLVKKSERGATNPNDPFYWRFLEFGTRKMAARPFLRKGADKLPAALAIFEQRIAKWINATDATGVVKE